MLRTGSDFKERAAQSFSGSGVDTDHVGGSFRKGPDLLSLPTLLQGDSIIAERQAVPESCIDVISKCFS